MDYNLMIYTINIEDIITHSLTEILKSSLTFDQKINCKKSKVQRIDS